MEQKWSIWLIRWAAMFGLIGTYLGSSMSGEGDYSMTPIHAHSLLVGWLSVFAWGIFYKCYTIKPKFKKIVPVQAICAMFGSFGLTFGMWMYWFNPFNLNDTFVMVMFIVGGTVLLLAFFLFFLLTFLTESKAKTE